MTRNFTFHGCLTPSSKQADVLKICGITQLLSAAMAGYHVTIFAYGQTGSGKTYTMSGQEDVIDSEDYAGAVLCLCCACAVLVLCYACIVLGINLCYDELPAPAVTILLSSVLLWSVIALVHNRVACVQPEQKQEQVCLAMRDSFTECTNYCCPQHVATAEHAVLQT